jgi:hypothetical protein
MFSKQCPKRFCLVEYTALYQVYTQVYEFPLGMKDCGLRKRKMFKVEDGEGFEVDP